MKRINLILNDLEFRLNRLACQNPLCFPATFKPSKFTISRNYKISTGGKDMIGHFYKNLDGEGYSIGMALSNAAQFTDDGKNFMPGSFDQKILLGIMSIAISNDNYHVDFKSIYSILKKLNLQPNIKNYNKLWDSFNKWSKLSILYKNTINVYNKNNDKKIQSLFIPSVLWAGESHWYDENDVETTNTFIRIRFTPEFLKLLGIKFSEKSLFEPILKLKGSVSQNLYLYLMGISGFLDNGKIVKRDIKKLCINKLAVSKKTRGAIMVTYLNNAIDSINKISSNDFYKIKVKGDYIFISRNK